MFINVHNNYVIYYDLFVFTRSRSRCTTNTRMAIKHVFRHKICFNIRCHPLSSLPYLTYYHQKMSKFSLADLFVERLSGSGFRPLGHHHVLSRQCEIQFFAFLLHLTRSLSVQTGPRGQSVRICCMV